MKDTEFIELLNLYLDHEISAADAARLEAEVQTNPARRRVYQQYCRMQKACKMVAADFTTDLDQASDTAGKKVVAFNPALAAAEARRKRAGTMYTIGTFAAVAACVAIIFVGQSRKAAPTAPAADQPQPIAQSLPAAPIANPDAVFVASDTASPRGLVSVPARGQQMLLVRDPLLLTGTSQAEAVRAAAVNQANNQLAWIESVQLTPLQQRGPADLHFVATLKSEGRALGNRANANPKAGQQADEMLMFQFVK
jgi:hypothetical protein